MRPGPVRRPRRPAPAPGPSRRDLLEAPFRHPWLVVVPLVSFIVAAVGASLLLPKRYRSSTFILVEAQRVPDSFVSQPGEGSARKRLSTLKERILSRTRLERVIGELDPYPTRAGREPMSAIVETMRGAITVRVLDDDAFTLEYVHTDPGKAMRVANRLAGLFIEETEKARQEQSAETNDFIRSELEDARRDLEGQEQAVRHYKETHMGLLPEQMDSNLATLQRLQLEQQSLSQSLRAAQDRVSLMEVHPAEAAGGGARRELARLRSELADLRSRYTEEHPDVRELASRIGGLEAAASGPLATPALAEARLEVESLKAKRAEAERRIAAFQARVEQQPRTEQELASLTRDFDKTRESYLVLLKKKIDAQAADDLDQKWRGERFKILDPARIPEKPVFPNPWLFLLLGSFSGLAAGLGLAALAETMDPSIRHLGDLESVIPFPVVACLPHIDLRQAPRSSLTA